jgi:hypothetical protein
MLTRLVVRISEVERREPTVKANVPNLHFGTSIDQANERESGSSLTPKQGMQKDVSVPMPNDEAQTPGWVRSRAFDLSDFKLRGPGCL